MARPRPRRIGARVFMVMQVGRAKRGWIEPRKAEGLYKDPFCSGCGTDGLSGS
jgi:hypothetical protein